MGSLLLWFEKILYHNQIFKLHHRDITAFDDYNTDSELIVFLLEINLEELMSEPHGLLMVAYFIPVEYVFVTTLLPVLPGCGEKYLLFSAGPRKLSTPYAAPGPPIVIVRMSCRHRGSRP
jgi:hypothetical protein